MNIFIILMLASMLVVAISLILGLLTMAKGGDTSKKYSNKLMQVRVYAQGVTIFFFALAVLSQGGS